MTRPAIEIKGLTRRFEDVVAVDDLSLSVSGPGVFGFLGANGAGKTTVIRMLVGLIHPSSGEIRLLGKEADGAIRRRIGYLPQEPAFYSWMTGKEYLFHISDLFAIPRKESNSQVERLLALCGLTDASRRRVGGYSGGMKQRLGIAQALINQPELLILDEPVSALDPVGRAEVLKLIEALGKQSTIFMSSHILADVERVCEKVAIINHGRLLVHEQTAKLRAQAIQPIVTLGVRGETTKLEARLRDEPWLVDLVLDPLSPNDSVGEAEGQATTKLRLTTNDLDAAELGIPRLVSQLGLGLVSLSPATPTLEEVFIALVDRNKASEEEKSA